MSRIDLSNCVLVSLRTSLNEVLHVISWCVHVISWFRSVVSVNQIVDSPAVEIVGISVYCLCRQMDTYLMSRQTYTCLNVSPDVNVFKCLVRQCLFLNASPLLFKFCLDRRCRALLTGFHSPRPTTLHFVHLIYSGRLYMRHTVNTKHWTNLQSHCLCRMSVIFLMCVVVSTGTFVSFGEIWNKNWFDARWSGLFEFGYW